MLTMKPQRYNTAAVLIRRICTLFLCFVMLLIYIPTTAYAGTIPRRQTPEYKVSYYFFDCFNMMDEDGMRYGYGYEMMQDISKYMQCTFSYIGYDKSAAECIEMLKNGEIDIYTAAKKTDERLEEFAFSTHPAITAYTSMNVKVGNTDIKAGDYSTYNGIRIGLLQRHTYNEMFLEWAESKDFSYEIIYYETPTELSRALVDGEVDALVNSYIGTPEDERIIENFGETPYYIMTRKEDQQLIDDIDRAVDQMNIELPSWRTDLYNRYYGAQAANIELTYGETELLAELRAQDAVIRAVLSPDSAPYSYCEDGSFIGITADVFIAAAEKLGLKYEFLPVSTLNEYIDAVASGKADIWLDADSELANFETAHYKTTEPYLKTTVSLLRMRRASNQIKKLAVISNDLTVKEIIDSNWPDAEVIKAETTKQCAQLVISGKADGALLTTYTAQKLARDDISNRLRTDIVQGTVVGLRMAVNSDVDRDFFGLWSKTLAAVSGDIQDNIVQKYVESYPEVTWEQYLADHPWIWVMLLVAVLVSIFFAALYILSVKSRNRQRAIANELSAALDEAKAATAAKNNFFSKMSHDIRTPLNAVLGMSQIALKHKDDPERLNDALNSISTEGNYLLILINSILDVNQLEHDSLELNNAPFDLSRCVQNSIELLMPIAEQTNRELTLNCGCKDKFVVGDAGRLSQIIINIVSNALKYTENGGQINVSFESLPDDRYRFTCRDNGIGMSEEFLKHITDDYVRAEDSRISKIQGTGLGMSIVKGLTELMGGKLSIESKLGGGSVFTVELPLAPASEEQRKKLLAPHDTSAAKQRFIGKKVLLAEDNELNAEIAVELLRSIGFSVDRAENGAVAVEMLENSAPDTYFAIFMDMQMPIMNGVDATLRIRCSRHPDHSIPIIAMTANTFEADKQLCRDAGMNGYISKPINTEAMIEALADY